MTSSDDFIRQAESPPYLYFRSTWSTNLASVSYVAPHGDNFNQVWSWYDHPLQIYDL